MYLPTQAPGVNRANRVAAAKAAGVSPAFWGSLLKKGLGVANDLVNG